MPSATPDSTPDHCPGPVVLSCPICGVPLQGRQTVCSPKCRIAKSRKRREGELQERDAKVRLLLMEALQLLGRSGSGDQRGT